MSFLKNPPQALFLLSYIVQCHVNVGVTHTRPAGYLDPVMREDRRDFEISSDEPGFVLKAWCRYCAASSSTVSSRVTGHRSQAGRSVVPLHPGSRQPKWVNGGHLDADNHDFPEVCVDCSTFNHSL